MTTSNVILVEKATVDEEREVNRNIEKWRTLSSKELESARERGKIFAHLKELTRIIWKRSKNKDATWDGFAKQHLDCSCKYGDLLIKIDQNWEIINAKLAGKQRNVNRAKKLLQEMFPSPNQGKQKAKAVPGQLSSATKCIKMRPSELVNLGRNNGLTIEFLAGHIDVLAKLINEFLIKAQTGVSFELERQSIKQDSSKV